MWYALQMARQALAFDEVPVGCIIICNQTQKIISYSHNKTISTQKTCMHAEIDCINNACEYFNNYRLPNCSMYVTLEPCCMCAGAIIHARLSNLYIGASDYKTGACGSVIDLFSLSINHHTKVHKGIMEEECAQELKAFFKTKRLLKKSK